jgi:alkanesulfonate monooxygenase SsuD/methylene tetrahydromethanopterin reductase-like flavin-dependent oxidoreductase (luciferase family)
MRFGIVILPEDPWVVGAEKWRKAEALGFDHAWTYDHLSWRTLADGPWHATVPTLTAAAMVTSRIRIGTYVTSPNFRHPVPFAKELATLDDISGGRMILGLGSGGTGFDATVLGRPRLTPKERGERYAEFVADLDELLRFEGPESGGISFQGDWFRADRARMVGAPTQSPRMPFVVAADGPRGMRLAGEYGDGWVTLGPENAHDQDEWWSGVAASVQRFDLALEQTGRDSADVDRFLSLDAGPVYSLTSPGAFADAVARATDLGFTDVVAHWPRSTGIYAAREGVLDTVASRFLTA